MWRLRRNVQMCKWEIWKCESLEVWKCENQHELSAFNLHVGFLTFSHFPHLHTAPKALFNFLKQLFQPEHMIQCIVLEKFKNGYTAQLMPNLGREFLFNIVVSLFHLL